MASKVKSLADPKRHEEIAALLARRLVRDKWGEAQRERAKKKIYRSHRFKLHAQRAKKITETREDGRVGE